MNPRDVRSTWFGRLLCFVLGCPSETVLLDAPTKDRPTYRKRCVRCNRIHSEFTTG